MKKLMCVCVIGLFFLLLFLQGGAVAEKPSVINLGLILDMSGPYAPVTGGMRPGVKDACEYINENNGVRGVPLKAVIRDSSGKIPVGLSHYNELISIKPKPLFFYSCETPLSEALRGRYKEDGVIAMAGASTKAIYPAANSFSLFANYAEQAAVGLKFIKDNWKEKRNPRVGIITWDTAYGRAIITPEFYEYVKSIGVDIVDTQLFGIRDMEVTIQMLKLRGKKADYLLTNSLGHGPLAIKKAAKEMRWNVTLINGQGGGWGAVRLAPEIFEGDIILLDQKSWDEADDPSIQLIEKYFKKNNRDIKDRCLFYLEGWSHTILAQHLFETVVDRFGWGGVNINNLKKVMVNLKDFRPLGGLSSYTYSEKRRSLRMTRIYKVTQGKLIPLSDFIETPDLRPAQYR